MNEFELKKAFGVIISRSDLDKNKLAVAELFYKNGVDISKGDILSVIKELGFKSIKDYKENSISLIMYYIYNALNDNKLSKAEKANIKFLKIALEIGEGDFLKNKDIKTEVANIIKIQLRLIYIDDDKIDGQESLHKVDLQEIFGLSYDEFLVFDKFEALLAIQRGAKLEELDTIVSYSDYLQSETEQTEHLEKSSRSRTISQEIKDKVWNRDGGRCILCGSNEFIEFDHIIPFSKGGANTYRNIQILCQSCNRSKSDSIGDD
jgi:hypothetical protein|tara:strand:+ start:645 stop:1433 length:789 start_codon:yes stop_codon:yes gene_type:complete